MSDHIHSQRCTRESCGDVVWFCRGDRCIRRLRDAGAEEVCTGHPVPSREQLIAARKGR